VASTEFMSKQVTMSWSMVSCTCGPELN